MEAGQIPKETWWRGSRDGAFSDGRTATHRTTGGKWCHLEVIFGERILVKVTSVRPGRRARLGATMVLAISVGPDGRSDALLAMTEFGAVRARSFKTLPLGERLFASGLENTKGLPRDWDCSRPTERSEEPSDCWSRDGWAADLADSGRKRPTLHRNRTDTCT